MCVSDSVRKRKRRADVLCHRLDAHRIQHTYNTHCATKPYFEAMLRYGRAVTQLGVCKSLLSTHRIEAENFFVELENLVLVEMH